MVPHSLSCWAVTGRRLLPPNTLMLNTRLIALLGRAHLLLHPRLDVSRALYIEKKRNQAQTAAFAPTKLAGPPTPTGKVGHSALL